MAASALSFDCDIREKRTVERAIREGDRWRIWLSTDEELTTRVLINAAGPWVNRVAEVVTPTPPTLDIRLVQGSHLLLNRPCPAYIYNESLDGRVMFFRPWKGTTLAGTTETEYTGDPARVKPTTNEITDILNTYNHYFPHNPCDAGDIDTTFCGLRVLPQTEISPFEANRESIILCDDENSPSYLAIYGGKLTTYRRESEKVAKLISQNIPAPQMRSTKNIPLQPS